MSSLVRQLAGFLSVIISLYMMLIFVRILLSWFRGSVRTPGFIAALTDPYIAWFRKIRFLRAGNMDFSPMAALAALMVLNFVLSSLAQAGSIKIGSLLAMLIGVIWSIASFFMGFIIIILVLRLIAYLTNQNTYGFFWQTIDSIAKPVLYRINRILFRGRIVNFMTSIIVSVVILTGICIVLGLGINAFSGFLRALPI